jgi:UDP:flavonoid glycosyltransferase YjiC (YdhE family)
MKMAKILVGSMPTAGHFNPLVPLARALVARGHSVLWYTGAQRREKVTALGAQHAPMLHALDYEESELGQIYPARTKLFGIAQLKHDMKHVFIDAGPPQLRDLQELTRDFTPDVMLGEPGFIGGVFYHELTQTPYVTLNVLPMGISSRDTAPFGLALPPVAGLRGRLRNRALNWAVPNVIFRDVQTHWNQTRARIGLAPSGWLMDYGAGVSRYLQPTVPGLEYPRSDLPANVRFIGRLPADPPADLVLPSWWSELDGGRPIVHVTQGTIANTAPDLFAPALQGLANDNVLVVIATGGRSAAQLGLTHLPDNARIGGFLPYGELLPKTSVMLTNGGYGGVQMALAAGVPVIVAGASEDKPEVAARVAYAGVGLNLKTARPTPQRVRHAVRTLLHDARYRTRARVLQEEFARYDAVALAVSAVEQLIGGAATAQVFATV